MITKDSFTIINDKHNKRNYKVITNFLRKTLLEHNYISMPKNLEIILFDYIVFDRFSTIEDTNTGIIRDGETGKYTMYLNLKQLLNLYKDNACCIERGMKKFKSFKMILLHALYHELGHYNLKHLYLGKNHLTYYELESREVEADTFGLKILGLL